MAVTATGRFLPLCRFRLLIRSRKEGETEKVFGEKEGFIQEIPNGDEFQRVKKAASANEGRQ